MTFQSIKPTKRADVARDQLLEVIESGAYQPGDKLPSENELTAQLGVSRVSVREALRSLEGIGLVEIQHGRGCFVTRAPSERYLEPYRAWLRLHGDDILELMKVRGALDELAAAEAATLADAELLGDVRRAHEAFAAAAETETVGIGRLARLDVEFHLAIACASRSKLVTQLLDELNQLFHDSRKAAFAVDSRAKRSAREHERIVGAIASGKAAAARSAAAAHLASARTTLAGLIETKEAGTQRRSGR